MPSVCVVARKCGGCRYTGVPYPEQLEIKQKNEEELLGRFGKVDRILGMRYPCFTETKLPPLSEKIEKEISSAEPIPKEPTISFRSINALSKMKNARKS